MAWGIGFSSTNYVTKIGNGIGPRTLVVSLSKTNMTQAELSAVVKYLGNAGGDGTGTDVGGPDAFTVAAVGTADGSAFVSGTTDVVYLALQGTGTVAAGADFGGVTGVTLAVVATFDQA